MMPFEGIIEKLASHHDRKRFSCGEPALDEYLRRFAGQHAKSKVSRSYVAAIGPQIYGFYSLSMSAIHREPLPVCHRGRFPNFPVPVARLARIAVDGQHQGGGLGKLLLMDAIYRCHCLSEEIGMAGVVVDAKHTQARAFYQKFEFESFPDTPLTLWLPVGGVKMLFSRFPTPDPNSP